MGKDKFVDRKLVNIRGKLMNESNEDSPTEEKVADTPQPRRRSVSAQKQSSSVNINDKEWKRSLFQRWDEFKSLRRDVLFKLNDTLSAIPGDLAAAEQKIIELKKAEIKLREDLKEVDALDDSSWDRHTLSAELASAMRRVENARMDCMMIMTKIEGNGHSTGNRGGIERPLSLVQDLRSLSFKQSFKLGMGLFLPLIFGIITAAVILAVFNYLTLM